MKRLLCVLMVLSMLLVTGCGNGDNSNNASTENGYSQITMQEAMSVFDNPGDYIILDVRTKKSMKVVMFQMPSM